MGLVTLCYHQLKKTSLHDHQKIQVLMKKVNGNLGGGGIKNVPVPLDFRA